MEHGSLTSNSNLLKRSFYKERQDRINYDPYLPQDRVSSQKSAPASERFLNFVKGKVHEAVATFKKLLDGTPESSSQQTTRVSTQYNLPQIPHDRLNNISSLIQETISKPEYQQRYNVNANKDPSKASFLNLMNFYKDVSADKIREKMEESHSFIIPEPVRCPIKPLAHYDNQTVAKKAAVAQKQRPRKGSQASNGSKTAKLNGKRELHSILSSKEKKLKERKKVHFKSEHQRSFSSMIRYTSSDEEDDDVEEPMNKTILSEISDVTRKDPALRLSMISTRKAKVNPFQRKTLVEKTSISQLLRSEKLVKKPYILGDDNIMNDSKVETDSEESNSILNLLDYQGSNIKEAKSGKDTQKKYTDFNDESEKGSPKFNEPSPKKYQEPNRLSSPFIDNHIIEEQDAEKEESSFGDQQNEKNTTIEMIEKPQEIKGLFGNQNNILSPVVKQESPKLQLKATISGELKLPSAKSSPQEKPQPQENASPLFNLNNSPIMNTGIMNPPTMEKLPSQEQPQTQQTLTSVVEPPKVSYEEALKNPIFASLNLKKPEPVEASNPFLNPAASKSVNTNPFLSIQPVETIQAPEQVLPVQPVATENTFLNNSNNQLAAPVGRPRGILDILQPPPKAATTPEASSSLFSNTLKPIASYSWLNQNQTTEEVKAPNLFGNFGANPVQQPALNTQPQGNLFGSLFAGGNAAGGMGMNNENVNSMMSESGNSLFNNNLFGGAGAFVNNNNNNGSLFGGNTSGGIGGALNQPDSMNSNPFLFNSGVGGGFNSNTNPVGGFSTMGNNSFSIDSGKKKKNQRERAF